MLLVIPTVLLALWVVPAAVHHIRTGRTVRVDVHQDLEVAAGRDVCSRYLQDPSNLAVFEPKVRVCALTVGPEGELGYDASGRFIGIPWWGGFTMEYTADGGFHSALVRGPFAGIVSGGFRLSDRTGGTRITHYESYRLATWLPFAALVAPFVRRWLSGAIEDEMVALDAALSA